MKPSALLMLLRMRVRWHPLQELLAAAGIAVGVALAFAVLVANGSISHSTGQVVDALAGRATLQVVARDSRGFDRRIVPRIRAIDGVRAAAPMLEQRAILRGPNGSASVLLGSIDPALSRISTGLPAWASGGLLLVRGLVLPQPVAARIGVSEAGASLAVDVRGRQTKVTLAAALGHDTLGALADASVAVMPVAQMEAITGLHGQVSRILVATAPHDRGNVARALRRVAGPGLRVAPAHDELTMLDQALKPSNQVTGFFAAMSVLLGFLLAFNAMLLTMPEQRRTVALLRVIAACPRGEIVRLVLFEAVVLGAAASLAGLLIGLALCVTVLRAASGYLSPAFTLGSGTVVTFGPVVLASAGGLAACLLASVPPIFDVFSGRPADELLHTQDAPGHSLGRRTARTMLAIALPLFALAIVLLSLAPAWAIVAAGLLALATVLSVPAIFRATLEATKVLTGRTARTNMLDLALATLRATTLRSLALAATGAVALYGCVAIGGARSDLMAGIAAYAEDYVGTADLWIVNQGDNQATNDVISPPPRTLALVPGVRAVRAYHGGFLDVGDQRTWIIARSALDRTMLPASQVIDELPNAEARLREGGWIAMSKTAADDRGVRLGERVTLPTPTGPHAFRLAATTTNLGWAPGAVIMRSDDYRRAWNTTAPTALEVDLGTGANPRQVAAALRQKVGPGVVVETAAARKAEIVASAQQGLARLHQITLLLLGAAVVALASAMTAAIWQRRRWLAGLRVQGCQVWQVWTVLLWESALVLGTGCLLGAIVGTYGQVGADRYLRLVSGFPVTQTLAGRQSGQVFAIVLGVGLVIIAIPGWIAARVSITTGLRHE